MQRAGIPLLIPTPFASGATPPYTNPIPTPSQIGIKNGAASFTDGFPPLTFIPLSAGGAGPFGSDVNGLFNQITAGLQWQQAGGPAIFSPVFQTLIGGYPAGAIVQSTLSFGLLWLSIVDNNLTNPDQSGAGWTPLARIRLSTDATFYVTAAGGSDTNPGTQTLPWATLQHAANAIWNNYDLNGFNVTIQCSGAFTQGVSITGAPIGVTVAFTQITFNFAAASSVIPTNNQPCFLAAGAASFQITGPVLLQAPGNTPISGTALYATPGSNIFASGIHFGACGISHNFGNVIITGSYTIQGGSLSHISVSGAGSIFQYSQVAGAIVVTLTGTPNFTSGFVLAVFGGQVVAFSSSVSFSGGGLGPRYTINTAASVSTNGSGVNFFPGSSGGTVDGS